MSDRQRRTGRAEWRKRVARWRESGLSAEEFASEIGVNAGTLRQWKYAFNREDRERAASKTATDAVSFVEVERSASALPVDASVFQLELARGRRLHIRADFDAAALERLLPLLERR